MTGNFTIAAADHYKKTKLEAVFCLSATVVQVAKLRAGYTSRSRLQIHHSQQASNKHFLL